MSKAKDFIDEHDISFDFLDNAKISESSLSRLLTHINDNEKDFAMVTAFRHKLSKAENRKRNKEMMNKFIKPNKIGATKVIGAFKEEGESEPSKEETFFLVRPDDLSPDKFKSAVLQMVKTYDQDSALIGIDGIASEMKKNGQIIKIGKPTRFDVKDLEGAFTRIKNNTFKFEGMYVPSGFMNAIAFKGQGLMYSLND